MTFNKIMSIRIICTLLLGIALNSFSAPRVKRYHPVFVVGQEQFHFTCPVPECSQTVKRNQKEAAIRAMLHHLKGSHAFPSNNTCGLCNSKFTSIRSLYKHYERHVDMKTHRCSYCTMKFSSSTELRQHDSSCEGRTAFQSPWVSSNPEE